MCVCVCERNHFTESVSLSALPKSSGVLRYRGTSHIRKRTPLGPYRRPMPRVLGGS